MLTTSKVLLHLELTGSWHSPWRWCEMFYWCVLEPHSKLDAHLSISVCFYPVFTSPGVLQGAQPIPSHPQEDAQAALLGLKAALSPAQGNTNLSMILGIKNPCRCQGCWSAHTEPSPELLCIASTVQSSWGAPLIPNYRGNPDYWADPRPSDIASNAKQAPLKEDLPFLLQHRTGFRGIKAPQSHRITKGSSPLAVLSAPKAWQGLSLHPWALGHKIQGNQSS